MRKKFVAAVAAFAALCGMVSVPANNERFDNDQMDDVFYTEATEDGEC